MRRLRIDDHRLDPLVQKTVNPTNSPKPGGPRAHRRPEPQQRSIGRSGRLRRSFPGPRNVGTAMLLIFVSGPSRPASTNVDGIRLRTAPDQRRNAMESSRKLLARIKARLVRRFCTIAPLPLGLVLVAITAPGALATDRWVPTKYTSIQAAINASVDGDNVWVRPGTYHENINLLGKSITVQSEYSQRATIDGDQRGACVTLDSGKASASLYGFRLVDGSGQYDKKTGQTFGGGICQTAGYLMIADCVVTGCQATWGGALFAGSGAIAEVDNCLLERCNTKTAYNFGGAIAVTDSTLNFDGSTIQDCGTTSYTSGGGGIYAARSGVYCFDALITRNKASSGGGLWLQDSDFNVAAEISGNIAKGSGGGAAVYQCHKQSRFELCQFTYNAADRTSASEGGGLWLVDSVVDLHNCDFLYNRSKAGGALATVLGSVSTIDYCSFRGNSARAGGGIYVNEADFTASNSIIAGNNALFSPAMTYDGGGGIFSFNGAFNLHLCTVTENRALVNASGIFHSGTRGTFPVLMGTIVWGNGGPGLARNIDDRSASQPMFLQECDYEVGDDPHPNLNFQVDPRFDPASFVYDLLPSSPLIDVVQSGSLSTSAYDFDGDPRRRDGNGDGVTWYDCGTQEY